MLEGLSPHEKRELFISECFPLVNNKLCIVFEQTGLENDFFGTSYRRFKVLLRDIHSPNQEENLRTSIAFIWLAEAEVENFLV